MFPSKNMLDYMTEINRLFPRTSENDVQTMHSNPVYMQSSFNNSPMANRSSSSADSISPESFPDISGRQFRPVYQPPQDYHTLPDTPFPMRRTRPIIGRNIMSSHEPRSSYEPVNRNNPIGTEDDFEMRSYWQGELQQTPPSPDFFTPPKQAKFFAEQKNYFPNVYELFPAENSHHGLRTPIKNAPSPQSSRFTSTNVSPSSGMSSMSPISPLQQRFRSVPPPVRRSFFVPPSVKPNEPVQGTFCSFCRKNGETPLVYMTHTVRERIGHRSVVTCPILRSHICSTCRATGDDAHTITYCPVLRSNNNGFPLQSTTITLKNTRVKSNGKKRY